MNFGFNSSEIGAFNFIILKWYFEIDVYGIIVFQNLLLLSLLFFFQFWRCFKMSNHQLNVFLCFWDLKTWRFSLALVSMLHHIYSHQNWILRNFIIHPSVTHSSITFASKNEFLRNASVDIDDSFLLFETEKQGNINSKLKNAINHLLQIILNGMIM